jgi:hypothetical protein
MKVAKALLVSVLLIVSGVIVTSAYAQDTQPAFICPAGSTQININTTPQTLVDPGTGVSSQSYNVNLPANTSSATILVNSMVGHPEQGCLPGSGNDPAANPWCDQGQQHEAFSVSVNGTVIGTATDHGEDNWQQFTFNASSAQSGANDVTFTHVPETGDASVNSVDYTAVLCVTVERTGGNQGCTPGYWRQVIHYDSWFGYAPNQSFSSVFGVGPNITLAAALRLEGGGQNALIRHAVAALLNAASGSVNYPYTTAQVIAKVQAAFATGNFEAHKNDFVAANELGCPLN